MDVLISTLFLTTWIVLSTSGESLFSLACSKVNRTCTLYKIDIDLSGDRALSNEIAQWHQLNVTDGFGSVAGFKNANTPLIIMTTACDSQANLINLKQLSPSLVPVMMNTSCTQPIYPLGGRYLLALGTMPNGVAGSYPISLYMFDAISGEWNHATVLRCIELANFGATFAGSYQVLHPQTGFSALNLNMREPFYNVILYNLVNETRHMLSISIETGGWTVKQIGNNLLRNFAFSTEINAHVSDCFLGGICLLNPENYQWDLFLPIPNFNGIMDWTFSVDKQFMYFISKKNVTVVDLSNNLSFHYRVLPLVEQSGDIHGIDKTVVFDMD